MDNERVAFLVTASCNGGCKRCSVRPWMEANRGYHMSLEEVAEFIIHSRMSGYNFREITLAGGEPLLWDHLLNGAALLKNSGIANAVCVITNGLMVNGANHDMISELCERVDTIWISQYLGNEDNVKYGLEHFEKIQSRQQVNRPVTPDHFVTSSLPAVCICRGRGYAHGKVTICAPVRTMGYLHPELNPITFGNEGCYGINYVLTTKLKEGFLSHFDDIERMNQQYCQACVANKRIHSGIGFVENEVNCG